MKIFIRSILCFFFISCSAQAISPYIHPDELMPLVYGEARGTVVWLWDLCYEEHPYFVGVSLTLAAAVIVYECSPYLLQRIKEVLNGMRMRDGGALLCDDKKDVVHAGMVTTTQTVIGVAMSNKLA